MTSGQQVSFQSFSFDFETNELRKDGKIVPLQPKQSEVLALLLTSPGKLITREEIRDQVWTSQVVEFDQSINFCIKCIRQILQDNPKEPLFIQTVPRRGYRFIADVIPLENTDIEIIPPEVESQEQQEQQNSQTINTKNEQNEDISLGELNYLLVGFKGFSRYLLASGTGLVFILTISLWWSSVVMSERKGSALPAENQPLPVAQQNAEQSVETDFKRALYLFNKVTFDDQLRSREIFKKILVKQPQMVLAHAYYSMAIAFTASSAEEYETANEHAQLARYYAQPNHEAEVLMAESLLAFYQQWDIGLAHESFLKISKLKPEWPLVWHELAVTAAIKEQYQLATTSIDKLLELSPGIAQERYHAGWFYMVAGRYEDALTQCQQSLEINPEHGYAKLCTGQMAIELGLDNIAKRSFVALVEQLSKTEISKSLMSQLEAKNYQAFYQWLIAHQQISEVSPFSLALSYARNEQFDEALAQLKLAQQQREPMLPVAWAMLEFEALKSNAEFIEIMNSVKKQ